jgi:hypothetical protein
MLAFPEVIADRAGRKMSSGSPLNTLDGNAPN